VEARIKVVLTATNDRSLNTVGQVLLVPGITTTMVTVPLVLVKETKDDGGDGRNQQKETMMMVVMIHKQIHVAATTLARMLNRTRPVGANTLRKAMDHVPTTVTRDRKGPNNREVHLIGV
jgi:hypothetical protein